MAQLKTEDKNYRVGLKYFFIRQNKKRKKTETNVSLLDLDTFTKKATVFFIYV